jgi:hypothetical protein
MLGVSQLLLEEMERVVHAAGLTKKPRGPVDFSEDSMELYNMQYLGARKSAQNDSFCIDYKVKLNPPSFPILKYSQFQDIHHFLLLIRSLKTPNLGSHARQYSCSYHRPL